MQTDCITRSHNKRVDKSIFNELNQIRFEFMQKRFNVQARENGAREKSDLNWIFDNILRFLGEQL